MKFYGLGRNVIGTISVKLYDKNDDFIKRLINLIYFTYHGQITPYGVYELE